ncbi:MAG: sugar nucleotide-binding protein [Acholeplasmataceae bacterium]
MNICITGMNGTIAPVVANHLATLGHTIIPLNRNYIDITKISEVKAFFQSVSPDWVLHFGLGALEWSEMLAMLTHELKIDYMYISTVMVFDGMTQQGPHHLKDIPNPKETYGHHKYQSEQAVMKANPKTTIVRLGWQIGDLPGSNQMINFLALEMAEKGVVSASTKAYPASSFLSDTAKAIADILDMPKDLYMVDSNDGLSLAEIITYLKKIHPWIQLKTHDQEAWNNQMIDPRIKIRKFSQMMK